MPSERKTLRPKTLESHQQIAKRPCCKEESGTDIDSYMCIKCVVLRSRGLGMGRENALECPHTEVAALLYKRTDYLRKCCICWMGAGDNEKNYCDSIIEKTPTQ